jgi:hypothetical protein
LQGKRQSPQHPDGPENKPTWLTHYFMRAPPNSPKVQSRKQDSDLWDVSEAKSCVKPEFIMCSEFKMCAHRAATLVPIGIKGKLKVFFSNLTRLS